MLKDITVGQFYSVKSPIHELDSRVKIRFVLVYIILSLLDRNLYQFGLLSFVCLFAVFLSSVPIRHMLKGMRGIILFIMLCSLINSFTVYGEVIFSLGALDITVEGVLKSIYVFWRMILIILMASLLMYTTTPTELTDGLEKCFALKGNVAMGITIALRFIPVLMEELDRIMKAQEMRGAEFGKGGPIRRIKSLRTVIIPLFQNSIDRAKCLAEAMDSRCYSGGKNRTKLRPLRYTAIDGVVYILLLVLLIVGIYFIIKF